MFPIQAEAPTYPSFFSLLTVVLLISLFPPWLPELDVASPESKILSPWLTAFFSLSVEKEGSLSCAPSSVHMENYPEDARGLHGVHVRASQTGDSAPCCWAYSRLSHGVSASCHLTAPAFPHIPLLCRLLLQLLLPSDGQQICQFSPASQETQNLTFSPSGLSRYPSSPIGKHSPGLEKYQCQDRTMTSRHT